MKKTNNANTSFYQVNYALDLLPEDITYLCVIAKHSNSLKVQSADLLLAKLKSERAKSIAEILLHPTLHNQTDISTLEEARSFHRTWGGLKEVENQMLQRAIHVQTDLHLGLDINRPAQHRQPATPLAV